MPDGDQLELQRPHYTPQELAEAWKVTTERITDIFRDEPGVLVLTTNTTDSRRYETIRIPESIAQRVYQRLLRKPKQQIESRAFTLAGRNKK